LRLEAAAHALEDVAAAAGGNVLHSVLAESAARWRLAFDRALAGLPQTEPGNGDAERGLVSRREAAIDRARRARQRLSTLGLPATNMVERTSPTIPSPPAKATRVISNGAVEELAVVLYDPAAKRDLVASASAALLAALAIFTIPALRFPPCRDWLVAHAHLLVALAGLAWWLLAPFGWLGWLPVLAALWSSLRFPHAQRLADSTWTVSRLPEPTQ
jgi:hypothetical protein